MQVACEMRSGMRNSRAVTSDLSFSRLELLECLWEDGKPQYSEVENLCVALILAVFTLSDLKVIDMYILMP